MKSLRFIFIAIFFLTGFLMNNCQTTENRLAKKVWKIHDQVLTVDTHCDTPMRFLRSDFDMGKRNDPHEGGGKVDFIRMKEGGMDAMFFAVFISQGKRTPEGNKRAREMALTTFDAILNTVNKHSSLAEIALNPDDAYEIEKGGKRAVYIGVENGYPVGNDLANIKEFYDLGARYITLCHTRNNDICDSSTDRNGPEHNGLSDFGRKIVAEMNKLGMIVDVSHISDKAFYDVLEVSEAPVIASHSCARAICDSPRNLTDDMLKKVAENGGVIQVCFVSSFIKPSDPYPERDSAMQALQEKYGSFNDLTDEEMDQARKEWTAVNKKFPLKLAAISEMIDHIDHIVNVAGIDCVGIGTDFDGGGALKDCYDVSQIKNITSELIQRGYTTKEIEKIWGSNFMRVFREVQKN
ncbi:MAG: membrane dipeptidase [Bacteroidetes bacterium]|nr:membrane dipeptidase [Bacteroidota bacterium]